MKRHYITYLAFLLTLFSCEKVIDVDVNDADDQTIVEAVLTDQPFNSFIILSKSGKLFEEGDPESIDSAIVEVRDQNGVVTVFNQIAPATYVNPAFVAQQGYTYDLTIMAEGNQFTSSASTPKRVEFDTTYIDYDYENPFGDIVPRVYVEFTDHPEPNTYYRVIAYKNGEKQDGTSIYDDDVNNGEVRDDYIYQFDFEQGDTLFVDLLSVNPAYYEYFRVLATISGNPLSSAPGNPPTNIDSDAKVQGYFGVFTVDRDTLYVTQ